MNNIVYLSLGSNLGNRELNLRKARLKIENLQDLHIVKKSSIIETDPVGIINQPKFLNQVISVNTTIKPQIFLYILLGIEVTLGRKRKIRYGPRSIDIDILLYNNQIIDEADLTVPHPKIGERKFILRLLNELTPNFEIPILNKTVFDLYKGV